jgi:ABC-2 type transport system ATP-binding protein
MPESMIVAENLTKRYAGHTAVSGVSFTVDRGEIVGLLGPNGAGKSTIMRILSGFMPATSGTVRIAGYDVFHDATEARRRIGYMPENNPLPGEMRVREYLKFRARLKGMSAFRIRDRLDTVIEQCGLADVHKKIIGHLSKGYKQRVGLADSLIHEPELVILDEPTIGLDPNQIRSVRQLIKSLGGAYTLLLSTHILPEVEMTCTRVLILHQGRIPVADTPENLRATIFQGGMVLAEIAAPVDDLRTRFEEIEQIEHFDVSPTDGEYFRCALTPRDGVDLRPIIFDEALRYGWKVRELTRERHTLEDIFVRVTKSHEEEGR